jgi:hypothetical protein
MDRLKGSGLACISYPLTEQDKRILIDIIERYMLFYDSVNIVINRKPGESSRGGVTR